MGILRLPKSHTQAARTRISTTLIGTPLRDDFAYWIFVGTAADLTLAGLLREGDSRQFNATRRIGDVRRIMVMPTGEMELHLPPHEAAQRDALFQEFLARIMGRRSRGNA